jgi:hypothetical protein
MGQSFGTVVIHVLQKKYDNRVEAVRTPFNAHDKGMAN